MQFSRTKLIVSLVIIVVGLCLFWVYKTVWATDPLELLPDDAIAYIEIRDISELASALTEQSARNTENLPKLRLGIAITNVEVSQSEEETIEVKPHLVAVAQAGYFESTNISFVETKFDRFVRKLVDDELSVEKKIENNERWFIWSKNGEEKCFAVVSGSLIYFGNSRTSIEKSLSVKRGESRSLVQTGFAQKRSENPDALIFGFANKDFISQSAEPLAVWLASLPAENSAVRDALAQEIASLLKNSIENISWKAEKREGKIEDTFFIKTDDLTSKVFQETLVAKKSNDKRLYDFIPEDAVSFSVYNLENPTTAWRSFVLLIAQKTSPRIAQLLNMLFEPYSIANPEDFLNAVESEIIVVRFDDYDETAVITKIKDTAKIQKAIFSVNLASKPEDVQRVKIWKSKDESFIAAFSEGIFIFGEAESVKKCLNSGKDLPEPLWTKSAVTTVVKDFETADKLQELFDASSKTDSSQTHSSHSREHVRRAETNFRKNGFEYKITSDTGFIGILLTALFSS